MEKALVQVKKVRPEAQLPEYHSQEASGFDLRACLDGEGFVTVGPHSRISVPTGLAFCIRQGLEIQVRSRSGVASKQGLIILNQPGTIDSDYRGEVMLLLLNTTSKEIIINHCERLAQGVVCPVVRGEFLEVAELPESDRGEGGFGSTGKD